MKASDKILLGIYNHRPILRDDVPYTIGELCWVVENGPNGWKTKTAFKTIGYPPNMGDLDSAIERHANDKNRVINELSILDAKNCIQFTAPTGIDNHFRILLTPNGLLRAEKLSTRIGKIDLWYSENKHGILGLIVTILISITTAVITTIIVGKDT